MVAILRLPSGVAAAAFFCLSLAAQPSRRLPWPFHHGKPHAGAQSPFALGREAPPSSTDVQFRSPGQMTPADHSLLVSSQAAIARHAANNALQFNQGNWTYRQIVCRALPNHLFLRFSRGAGPADLSLFTVSIPRNGHGRVRVIPILRRGYALFSPAPGNADTIAAFNRIRSEDGPDPDVGWLETGLCYAALAGASPRVGPLTGNGMISQPTEPLAELEVPLNGGAVIRFTDQNSRPRPTLWTMVFNPQGSLLKVRREPAVRNARFLVPAAPATTGATISQPAYQPAAAQSAATRNSSPPSQPASR